ncbi:hypothetical protein VTO73DRAFT_11431 [Trametes versicolor]
MPMTCAIVCYARRRAYRPPARAVAAISPAIIRPEDTSAGLEVGTCTHSERLAIIYSISSEPHTIGNSQRQSAAPLRSLADSLVGSARGPDQDGGGRMHGPRRARRPKKPLPVRNGRPTAMGGRPPDAPGRLIAAASGPQRRQRPPRSAR